MERERTMRVAVVAALVTYRGPMTAEQVYGFCLGYMRDDPPSLEQVQTVLNYFRDMGLLEQTGDTFFIA